MNKNLKNNQNYIISKKIKKSIISYAFLSMGEKGNTHYQLKNLNGKYFRRKMYLGEIGYLENVGKVKLFLGRYLLFEISFFFFLFFLLFLFLGGTMEINGREIDLTPLNYTQRFFYLKWILIFPIFLFIIGILNLKTMKKELKKYYIFKEKINENKIFIKKIKV